MWGATEYHALLRRAHQISIHAPRVGSDLIWLLSSSDREISIHAPRVGSDFCRREKSRQNYHFNPRSPCGERLSDTLLSLPSDIFQSTLPVWGATAEISKDIPEKSNITYTYCTKAKMIDSIYLLFLLCILSYSTKIRCEHHWKNMSIFPSHYYKIIGSSGR